MNRRVLRRIALVLVAAQLLLSAPVTSALAAMAPTDSQGSPCAEMMPVGGSEDSCPCCPAEGMNAASCLSACMPSTGAIPALAFPLLRATAPRLVARPILHRADLADPPLKPPPIV